MSDLIEILFSPSNETRLLLLLGITLCAACIMISTALISLYRAGVFHTRTADESDTGVSSFSSAEPLSATES